MESPVAALLNFWTAVYLAVFAVIVTATFFGFLLPSSISPLALTAVILNLYDVFGSKGSASGMPFDSGPLTIANGGTFTINGITFRLRLETDGRLIITDVNKALVLPGAGTVKLTVTLTGLKAKENGSPFEWMNARGKKASTTMKM